MLPVIRARRYLIITANQIEPYDVARDRVLPFVIHLGINYADSVAHCTVVLV